jgi:ubiquinone/menaquinone biosynthesis C-methylase UbiE
MVVLLFGQLLAGAYDRDSWQKPEKVMDVIGVKTGMIIGVAGAGHGYFSFKMARRVGQKGHIYANEISQRKIDHIERRCRRENIKNISTILGEVEDPLFPPAKMDMVFMCYVFHDLARPVVFLKNITKSLRENAAVVIMEQDPGKTGSQHFFTQKELRRKVKAAGYEIFRMETFLEKDNIYLCRPRKQG